MSDSHVADVQAELQQYLNSKNINGLFIQIVESLLIEKPANPVAFMIEYLYKQFPDQARQATPLGGGGASGNANANANATAPKSEAKAEAKHADKKPDKHHKKDDNSDDDEDDFAPEDASPVPVAKAAPQGKSRRTSVSAESMDPNKMKAQANQVTCIEKSPDVTRRLLEVVSRSPLLRTLDDDQKDTIVKAFTGPLVKQPGENVIVQGDIGDIFYLLEDGLVDVYVSKRGGPETKVHTYTPGNSFGELAIMYNAPRAATCRAQSECKLWALDRVSFKVIVVAAAMQKRELYVGFLKQVPILASLTEMEIMTLADSLAEERYHDEQVVCHQGDAGDYFYIIKEGTAICTQKDATGGDKVVATLKSGNYFGEIALLTEKPRQATVKAQGNLKVLALDRATFTRVMGPMEEIMKRNMQMYNKYTAEQSDM